MKKFFFRVKQTLNITFRIRDTDEKTVESIQLSNITVQNHDYYKYYNIFAFSLSESSKDDSKRQKHPKFKYCQTFHTHDKRT